MSFFQGKTALVTGGASGIGYGICKALHALGAKVCMVDVNAEALKKCEGELPGAKGIAADLMNPSDIAAAVEKAGDVDFLVNCAAITILEPFLEMKLENFQKLMKVNVEAMVLVSQGVARNMVKRGAKGAIVNLASQGSKVGLVDHTAYCTSKGAVDQLTHMMALELGSKGIRVNALNPTVVMTDMGKKAWSDPVKAAPMLARIPLGKFAEVEHVVKAVLFLLETDMVNGVTLPLDGGFLAAPFNTSSKL